VAKDHLGRVREKVEIIVDALDVGRGLVVPSCPVTVDEEPARVNVNCVPAVIRRLAGNAVAGTIACSLRPAGD